MPWRPTDCGWVLNLAVAPAAQRRGLGRALLPTVELSVVDGGPGRRPYDTAGFDVITRVLSVPLPGTAAA